MAATLDVLNTTRERWVKALSNETITLHPVTALLRDKGLIDYNCSGTKNRWSVKYKELDLEGYGVMEQLTWDNEDQHKKPELPWRGYKMRDAVPELAMMENSGQEAIVKLFTDKLGSMREDAISKFNQEFYVDGNAAGNEKRFHGIPSFLGYSTQTAGDQYATTPNDTYAELLTNRGTYGGSSDADVEGKFWTPQLVHTDVTGKTWAADADELLRRGFIKAKFGKAKTQAIDLVLCTEAAYLQLVELLQSKERLHFARGSADGIAKFGFTALSLDGVDIMYDPDIPSALTWEAYGFATNQMELCVLGKELWHASGSTFNEDSMSFRYWVGTYGNFRFKSPRRFAAWGPMA